MISNLKELEAALKLCRKMGVAEFKIGDVSIRLGEEPSKKPRGKAALAMADEPDIPDIPDDQLIFFSARPMAGG